MTQTTAGGHDTDKASLQLRPTTPFLDFHAHLTNPFIVSHPMMAPALPRRAVPGTGSESIITPKTLFSFALAADAQSAAESARGMLRREAAAMLLYDNGGRETLLPADERFIELRRLVIPGAGASPSPVVPFAEGKGRK